VLGSKEGKWVCFAVMEHRHMLWFVKAFRQIFDMNCCCSSWEGWYY